MSEQVEVLETRIQCKYDTQDKWYSTGFIPDRGELCVFAPDKDHLNARLKIGDGVTTIYDLPFVEIGDYINYEPPAEVIREASISDASSSLSVRVSESISSHQIIVAANGDNGFFDSTKCVYGTNINSWFSNLPEGLTAKIYYNNPDSNTLIIEFTGTPTTVYDNFMNITIPASYNTDNKDVVVNANNKKFTINRTAQVSDVTISGELGKQITEQTIVVTVGGSPYPFTEEVAVNKAVTTWFGSSNFPHGLSAVVTNIDKTNNKVTIKFSGAPIVLVDNSVMNITIPAKYIVEGKELVVDTNNNAKFNIVEGEHEPAYSASINTKFILSGTQYSVLDESDLLEIIIEGTNPELIDYPATGLDVTHWFKNIPEGLVATIVYEELTATQNLVLVGFSGTPQVACSERMSIIIPKEDFAAGGTDVIDTPVSLKTYVVKFEIAEYVEPEPVVVRATLTDVTISKRIHINTVNTLIQINLEGAEWNYDVNQSNVNNWITNLPEGLSATVTGIADKVLTIKLSETPVEVKVDSIRITIPGTALSTNEQLVVEENVNAKFDIREPYKLNVPTQKNTLVYTGYSLTPQWNDYDSSQLTKGGDAIGIDAGSYPTTFSIKDKTNYCWNDYSQDDQTVTWTIAKADPVLTVSSNTVKFDDLTKSVTVTYSSVSSADFLVAGQSDKFKITTDTTNKTITFTLNDDVTESFTAPVNINQKPTSNYNQSNVVQLTVSGEFIVKTSFEGTSWQKINELAINNQAKDWFEVGDCKQVHIEYTLTEKQLNTDLCVFIVQINVNNIILQGFKSTDNSDKHMCLIDNYYDKSVDYEFENAFGYVYRSDDDTSNQRLEHSLMYRALDKNATNEGVSDTFNNSRLFDGLNNFKNNGFVDYLTPFTNHWGVAFSSIWERDDFGNGNDYDEISASPYELSSPSRIVLPSISQMFSKVALPFDYFESFNGDVTSPFIELEDNLLTYYRNGNFKFTDYDRWHGTMVWSGIEGTRAILTCDHYNQYKHGPNANGAPTDWNYTYDVIIPHDYSYSTSDRHTGVFINVGFSQSTSYGICPLFKIGKKQN